MDSRNGTILEDETVVRSDCPSRCLYNHELLSLFTTQSPYQTYRDNVGRAQIAGFVEELAGTQVDTLMCCPQAWMTPLWPSEIDPKWRDEAPVQTEPLPECDWKYFEKAYYRIRRTMLTGCDPTGLTVESARRAGLRPFISYRMNEIHYVRFPDCPTHSRFWREHPEWHLSPGGTGSPLNYLIPEVRNRYLAILSELVERYDVDGLELDFMRHPTLFPPGCVDEGTGVLTDFVGRVHDLLCRVSECRGRRLRLSVRVPRSPAACRAAGMDVAQWDERGWLDIVNASPHFRTTPELDIEGFRQCVRHALIFGELHFNTQGGATSSGYSNNINRRTTPLIYETTALSFWDRGVDGISFFNFAYTRDHSFGEARRREFPGCEPPFEVLRRICDTAYLRRRPRHYILPPGFESLPVRLGSPSGRAAALRLYVADRMGAVGAFCRGVLRLEVGERAGVSDIAVRVNGSDLTRIPGSGELFRPFSMEALPSSDRLLFYDVPPVLLRHGWNDIELENRTVGEYALGTFTVERLELALYLTPDPADAVGEPLPGGV